MVKPDRRMPMVMMMTEYHNQLARIGHFCLVVDVVTLLSVLPNPAKSLVKVIQLSQTILSAVPKSCTSYVLDKVVASFVLMTYTL